MLLVACASESADPVSPSPAPVAISSSPEASPESIPESKLPAAAAACTQQVTEMTLKEQVGQLYMVGVSTKGLNQTVIAAIEANAVGSVVLLEQSTAGAAPIKEITADLEELAGTGVPILVAVDQEGGTVQRLRGAGFSEIPTALEQSKLSDEELLDSATGWGTELAEVGVKYNLAPVADVVPVEKQESNAPIGKLRRNYGNDKDAAASSVKAFVQGMKQAGVATSLKHFPGLGQVTVNTDFGVAVDSDVTEDYADWGAFKAGIDGGAQSVMISSAKYEKLDPGVEAVFSEAIVSQLLRDELGFEGVIISDDLGAAAAVADVPIAERGVRFLQAGGNLVINADPASLNEMAAATIAKAEADPDFSGAVFSSTARVLALKDWLGLVECED